MVKRYIILEIIKHGQYIINIKKIVSVYMCKEEIKLFSL